MPPPERSTSTSPNNLLIAGSETLYRERVHIFDRHQSPALCARIKTSRPINLFSQRVRLSTQVFCPSQCFQTLVPMIFLLQQIDSARKTTILLREIFKVVEFLGKHQREKGRNIASCPDQKKQTPLVEQLGVGTRLSKEVLVVWGEVDQSGALGGKDVSFKQITSCIVVFFCRNLYDLFFFEFKTDFELRFTPTT